MPILKLFIVLFFWLPFISYAEILSHETTVEMRNAKRIEPHISSSSSNNINDFTSIPNSQPSTPKNVISSFQGDVYTLSESAKFLALPHMISPEIAKSFTPQLLLTPEWSAIIKEASQLYGIDENLIAAVIKVESNFISTAISQVGAQGAMQIMPTTGQDLGLIDPFNPHDNVLAGTKYLKQLLDEFQSLDLALAAYNAGPANVRKYNGIPPFTETQNFINRVKLNKEISP